MQSLRTKRPAQKTQVRSQKTSRPTGSTARNAAARKSTVDDKIKKRMSMRYADTPLVTSAEPGQGVPPLPAGLSGRSGQRSKDKPNDLDEIRNDPRAIETRILEKDDFNPDAYLKVKLSNSTEAEIKSLQSSLEGSKEETSAHLQQNVVKNYPEFFMLSKEISMLENDLLELKDSLAEWKAMPSLLHIDDSIPIESRRTNRSSVADLRVLYADQIIALHARIEGSSKFVPAIPGRHIVSETAEITSLNVASYKPEQSVHFVLLDDTLLLSRHRRRRDERNEGKLVAIRCWNLADIVVLDIKDNQDLTNVFKIKDGKTTYVFRTAKVGEKRALLASFRQVAEEFAARKRKQRETEHEKRRSVFTQNDSLSVPSAPVPNLPDWLQAMGNPAAQTNNEQAERDLRWANDYGDGLAVAIALRDWDDAVSLVETGEERANGVPPLASKLPPLKASLIRALLTTLSDPTHRKAKVVHLSSLLIRLDASMSARTAFLSTRSELLRKRIRTLSFDGDTRQYISDLSMVVFTSIKHSADWYFGSFRENECASTFVEWAKQQMQSYVDVFRTQVYFNDTDSKVVEDCKQTSRIQSKRLLGENGLDFSVILRQIHEPPDSDPLSQPSGSLPPVPGEPEAVQRDAGLLPPRSANRPTGYAIAGVRG